MFSPAYLKQIELAATRYSDSTSDRETKKRSLEKGDWQAVDDPGRITRRMISRGMMDEVGQLLAAKKKGLKADFNPLERIIGDDELLTTTFL